ncbi:MAG TPA: 30S ribosomal protein S12 methylthiotransferase RimO [Bacteroidales bacterium]|nr:30S ribosomal protein S12 methylthiotransferase RimO [Bacteroidales bacterium]
MPKNKINIVTLGCSKNVVDSEKLMRQLGAGGFKVVHDPEDTSSGTVIINTCGFIHDAKEESIDTILRFVKARQTGDIENLYVMGCLAERYMHELKQEIPEVKQYFGVNNFSGILKEMGLSLRDDLLTERMLTGPDHYAYLKISEGCDRKCAFCAIPLIRGKYTSRPVNDLMNEAEKLASAGVKELILIAQDLSYYGLDLYRKQALPELVMQLSNSNLFEWVRLHYLYPSNFPKEIIKIMQDNKNICSYIDIPLQHISDSMLKLMKRSHGRKETLSLLDYIRKEIPTATIRTTFIAGHPGEKESDYVELRDFIQEFRFDRLGVFSYSHEEDTYSYSKYKDDVPEETKQSRVDELMAIQQDISAGINRSKIGTVVKVLIDRKEGDYFAARTEFDSPEVDQEVLISSESKLTVGNFYDIEITDATEFDLFGKPVLGARC